ncbi:response regulator receiver domain-containing protein [Paraburkholderia sp. RAU2J]|uniref:response regulator n=1 Tax=Paraburkholderia sp. RAU2J TaxID=1938810 RepID=UPI000EB5A9C0|nr:response regulator [Paraburkholderia sp. RAU2J]RKT13878.1 response regulator receiver domain-containing protein [Paraburkholderia sp. RAU2J]
MHTIKPFYFPTTVTFVDDSPTFLSNLCLQLDPQLAFRLFSSPGEALDFVNSRPRPGPLDEPIFAPFRDRTDEDVAHQVIALSVNTVRKQVHNAQRFLATSVVVVDYDMPGMNGLEFCRRMTDPTVRKIMLTGKADEHIAVQSFNEGIIHRFISKQDAAAVPALNRAVRDLQNAYFDDVCQSILDTLAVSEYAFLRDEALAARVAEISDSLGIVEHYLSYCPGGLLMLDSGGKSYLLIVHTDETLRGLREIAIEQDAPAEFLKELDSRRSLPYFWQTEGHYPTDCTAWEPYMHPATQLGGRQNYVYSVISNPPGLDLSQVLSYDHYLERLDREM